MKLTIRVRRGAVTVLAALLLPAAARGQESHQRTPGEEGSRNMQLLSHVPLGAPLTVSDVELEQDLSRPFAYVGRMFVHGTDVMDVSDPSNVKLLHSWRIEDAALHQGTGMMDGKIFEHGGRNYYVQSTQFQQGGPDTDLGAVVFDVTDLPDPRGFREVARIRAPQNPGGFHNIFIYKHSDGRPLLITTVSGPYAHVYDLSRVVEGEEGLAGRVPLPEGTDPSSRGYHDMYAAYDPADGRDKFYGGGTGGYHIYDISSVESPAHLFSIVGVSGVTRGHTFTPSPDGAFAVGETEYQYAPLRIYDLRPGQSGETRTIGRPIGAWTANWKNLVHNHEVRWPYVFVSGYEDGLQIFNMMDPADPYTVGLYDTYSGPPGVGMCGDKKCNGAFGVDVRNEDGLIVVSDMSTGFWTFRMDGFEGWNGERWGMPNISSVQDWENGPVRGGATTNQR